MNIGKGLLYGFLMVALVLVCGGCAREGQQLEIEIRRSMKNFIASVDELHEEGLYLSVYFPGEKDYPGHVRKLLLAYLDELYQGKPLTFDEQGVVLSRFLGMMYHLYTIKEVVKVDDQNLRLRLSFNFNFDQTMKAAHYEPGTTTYVPGKPWGTAHKIVIDQDVPVPREQIKYLETVVELRRTNHEGFWQVRKFVVDQDSIQWETSIDNDF